ncbi:MAG: DinB family protein [Anaerolineales bacterium]
MTTYPILLEQIEDRWIGHLVDVPGCFSNGPNPPAAAAAVPAALQEYVRWRSEREPGFTAVEGQAETLEQIPARHVGDDEINAFFEADRAPLTKVDVKQYTQLLQWSRQSLLRSTLGLHDSHMRLPLRGERWPIYGVLEHVANAENWYLERLGHAGATDSLPEEAFARLKTVRAQFFEIISQLAGDDRVVERDGELWSARKLLRRALWHERDHTAHIRKMRAQLDD